MKVGKVRGIYKACEERNRQIVKLITSLKSEHPYWGYRRIWANLRHYHGINISQNTIYKLIWQSALEMAINRQFPDGVRGKGLSLVSDNGCQPTSVSFMKNCGILGILS